MYAVSNPSNPIGFVAYSSGPSTKTRTTMSFWPQRLETRSWATLAAPGMDPTGLLTGPASANSPSAAPNAVPASSVWTTSSATTAARKQGGRCAAPSTVRPTPTFASGEQGPSASAWVPRRTPATRTRCSSSSPSTTTTRSREVASRTGRVPSSDTKPRTVARASRWERPCAVGLGPAKRSRVGNRPRARLAASKASSLSHPGQGTAARERQSPIAARLAWTWESFPVTGTSANLR